MRFAEQMTYEAKLRDCYKHVHSKLERRLNRTSKAYSLCAGKLILSCQKVAHLMKGISEDLYQTLLVQDFRTVDEFAKRCREIESLRRRRITRTRFQRLPNISAVLAETDVGDIKSLIREIVWEELG
ncbi:hypothetical protein AVEN_164041-1 [Araneus ventricosus]|nr:hypothetical protein AVEN_47637-1 [Araneus ventricosus]GBN03754.1 hypothetical protein AVEN_164041-1 [Araneus ventricosus]